MTRRKLTTIFFATDIHGSERCFRKFIRAAKFYNANVLILGGDITGKLVIPIEDLGNGTFRADFVGSERIAKNQEEVKGLEQLIANSGYYYYNCGKSEMDDLRASKEKVEALFLRVMKETLARWLQHSEQALEDTETICYITGGNDDLQEVIDGIRESDHVRNPENKVVKIDTTHEMASVGWTNPTPWKCPRECNEEELEGRIESLLGSLVSDPRNCILNFHAPPLDCGLDTVQQLDGSTYPPKVVVKRGQPVMIGAGSESVRRAIQKYQPILDLCGHVHESRGTCKIGRTLVINPGSEYPQGILRGVIVNLANEKVVSWQLTSG